MQTENMVELLFFNKAENQLTNGVGGRHAPNQTKKISLLTTTTMVDKFCWKFFYVNPTYRIQVNRSLQISS